MSVAVSEQPSEVWGELRTPHQYLGSLALRLICAGLVFIFGLPVTSVEIGARGGHSKIEGDPQRCFLYNEGRPANISKDAIEKQ